MKLLFNIFTGSAIAIFIIVALLLLLSAFKPAWLPLDARSVLTGSMEPAIRTGSLVFIYPYSEYQIGDIVMFKPDGNDQTIAITHRIVGTTTNSAGYFAFVTKGDANEGVDREPVLPTDIYGKAVFHIPFLGRLLDIAKTPWGFAALIIIPAVLVIREEIQKIRRELHTKAAPATDEQQL